MRACWRGGGLSYLAWMNFDAGSQFSVGHLIAGALGATVLGGLLALLLAALLHAGLHAAGAFATRLRSEKEFSWRLALLGAGLCAVVGGWTGLKVGVARAAVPFARDLGPKVAEEALQNGLRQAGMTNFAQLDVKRLREFVAKAGSAELPALDHFERFRPEIEAARTRLMPAAWALLDAHAKDGKLALHEAVSTLWPKVFNELTAWEQRFRRWEIVTGSLWVVGVEISLALVCLAMRLTRDPLPAGPSKPPKL